MKNIVICEGASSAILYVTEAKERGYNVIIIDPPRPEYPIDFVKMSFKKKVGNTVKTITVGDEGYEGLLKELRQYDIDAVVAGSEYGVRYADMLAKDLSLNGNNPKTTYMRCTKRGMTEGLKKGGLRHIAMATVKSDEDIDRFWDENDVDVVFMKQDEGVASVNSKLCRSREEAKDHFRKTANCCNSYGIISEMLIQEFIIGKEYAVNTMSCRGHHSVTDVWEYLLAENNQSNLVHKWTKTVDASSKEFEELLEYAIKVVDALGFEYGPCHGEYFLDSKGPVLIETNARPMGLTLEADYYDEFIGCHISDLSLDTYIRPEEYIKNLPPEYIKPKKCALVYTPHSQKETETDVWKYFEGIRNLKSFRSVMSDIQPGKTHIPKTTDLDTVIMAIKLCGNEDEVLRDVAEIKKMEKKYNASL